MASIIQQWSTLSSKSEVRPFVPAWCQTFTLQLPPSIVSYRYLGSQGSYNDLAMIPTCKCIHVKHPSEDNVYKVEMINDDQVSALSSYTKKTFGQSIEKFRGELDHQSNYSLIDMLFELEESSSLFSFHLIFSLVRILSIQIESILPNSDRGFSPMNAPISLKACAQCEGKMSSCPSERFNFDSSTSETADRELPVPAFSSLLKRMFFEDNYGCGTATLAIYSKLLENEATNPADQLTFRESSLSSDRSMTPNSHYSPLTLGSAHGSQRKFPFVTKLPALLYPVSLSIGILQIETPNLLQSTPLSQFTVDEHIYDFAEDSSAVSGQTQGPGIAFKSSLYPALVTSSSSSSSSRTTPVLRVGKLASLRGLSSADDQCSLSSQGDDSDQQYEMPLSRSTTSNSYSNRFDNSRKIRYRHSTPTMPLSTGSRSSRGDSSGGSNGSRLASVDREKGSRRSIAVANTLFSILNGSGSDGDIRVRNQPPLAKTRKKPDMKLLLKQSSAGAFEGLQLDLVDPDFVFPGSRREESSRHNKRSSHCSRGDRTSASSTTPLNVRSIDHVGNDSIDDHDVSEAGTPSINTDDVERNSKTTAVKTVDPQCSSSQMIGKINPSSATEELLYWKEECCRKQNKVHNREIDNSGTNTPSTAADSQTLDHDTEFSRFAGTYGITSKSYEVMPLEDGSLFAGLNSTFLPVDSGIYSELEAPGESLAYSQFSSSSSSRKANQDENTSRTEDMMALQVSSPTRSSSLLGKVFSVVESISKFGFYNAVIGNNTSVVEKMNFDSMSTKFKVNTVIPAARSNIGIESITSETDSHIEYNEQLSQDTVLDGISVNEQSESLVVGASLALPSITKLPVAVIASYSGPSSSSSSSSTSSSSSSSCLLMADLNNDETLQPMLVHLNILSKNVVSAILNCVIQRNTFVFDTAVHLRQIFKENDCIARKKKMKLKNGKKHKNEKNKKEKSEIQIVTQVLEKMMKQRLGTSTAVGQAVSSCCLLLVYLHLEMQKELEDKEENVKKAKIVLEGVGIPVIKADKIQLKKEKKSRENANDLISSTFDRLALTALSPFLSYEDVQWLSFTSGWKGKRSDSNSKECSLIDNNGRVICNESSLTGNDMKVSSSLLQKRKSITSDDISCLGTEKELKRKKSVSDEIVTMPVDPPKSKRDCLREIISILQDKYKDIKSVDPALRRLARSYRPSSGNISGGTPESEYSPTSKSPGELNSPDLVICNSFSYQGEVSESVGDSTAGRPLYRADDVPLPMRTRVKITAAERTKPMIPLSIAGTALLLSKADISSMTNTVPLLKSTDLVTVKTVTAVPIKKGDNALRRTNSIVNVHKPFVGQRTGRGKGKNVRTSLKPDPNINSILSFTVPQRRSPVKGARQLNTLLGSEKEKDKNNLSAPLSGSRKDHNDDKQNSDTISTVRRSSRKREREDSDGWGGQLTQTNAAFDVNEVEDTPFEKVRERKSRGYGSALRILRGDSPVARDTRGRPPNPHDIVSTSNISTSTRRRSVNSSNQEKAVSKGIALLLANTTFSSGGSGKKKNSRSLITSPFFLPPVELQFNYTQSQDGDIEESDGNDNFSAAAALGMEELSQKKKRIPRMIRLPPQSQSQCDFSSSGRVTIPEAIIDSAVGLDPGSFTRTTFERSNSYDMADDEEGLGGRHHSLVQVQGTPLAMTKRKRGKDYSNLSSPIEKQNLTRTFSKSPMSQSSDNLSSGDSEKSHISSRRSPPRLRRTSTL